MEKKNLVSEQRKLLRKNDLVGVVQKFNEIATNIDSNCPNNRVESERVKFREKTRQWNAFSPRFPFNKKLDEVDIKMLPVGTENQCAKLGDYFYNFSLSDENQKLIMKEIPLVRNNELATSSNGVYTWIIFTDNEGEYQFVAKKVLTIQELSTKHHNIVRDILDELSTIHFAGELLKKDDDIEINFLSGSYMAVPFEDMKPVEIQGIHNNAINFLNQRFDTRLKFTDQREVETLITRENIVYTHGNIKLLLEYGAIIKRFETKKLCNRYERRKLAEISAVMSHEQNMRVWDNYGGEKPVYNYDPDFEDYDINLENLYSIDVA